MTSVPTGVGTTLTSVQATSLQCLPIGTSSINDDGRDNGKDNDNYNSSEGTNSDNASSLGRIHQQLQDLATLHQMEERCSQSKSRNKLQPRHIDEFPTGTLFDQFARIVCQTAVIPRKEVFETWAMALYVHHHHHPLPARIADVACSHGLLSWALLLLATTNDDDDKHSNDTPSCSRSAVCIDLKMPKSAERIADAMLAKWPHLQDHWDYVEGPAEALVIDASTLLVGIHACGLLSDKLIGLAMDGKASLALVPCCHSRKCLTPDQEDSFQQSKLQQKKQEEQEPPTQEKQQQDTAKNINKSSLLLAAFLDQLRIQRLRNGGFHVQEAVIPRVFTPQNRILLATPSSTSQNNSSTSTRATTSSSGEWDEVSTLSLTTKGQPSWGMPQLSIPVADTPEARAEVRRLAGRAAANQRKAMPPPTLCISIFLPTTATAAAVVAGKRHDPHIVSSADLEAVLWSKVLKGGDDDTTARVETLCEEPFFHPVFQRYARTFRIQYPKGTTKPQAKEYHAQLRTAIPKAIPGATVRY